MWILTTSIEGKELRLLNIDSGAEIRVHDLKSRTLVQFRISKEETDWKTVGEFSKPKEAANLFCHIAKKVAALDAAANLEAIVLENE
jgi:hypothetical protein